MLMPMVWLSEVRSWDSFMEQFVQHLQGVREQTVIGFGKMLGADVQVQGRPQPSAPAGGSSIRRSADHRCWWIFRPVSFLHTWQHHWHRHTVASMIVSVRSMSGFFSQNASTSIGASLR
jgi:hypothetical protein